MPGTAIESESPINESQGIPKPSLDVTAHAVDTYVRPVSPEKSSLGQLAGALKDLNPALEKIETRFQDQAEQQGEAAGTAAFAKDSGDWDKAIANGDVPSILNPWARQRARETFGKLSGDKMGNDIRANQDYIRENANATTLQQHDDAWARARQQWEKENLGHTSHSDPLFQLHYQAMAAVQTQEERNRAVPEIEKNFVTLNGKHLSDLMTNHLQDGISSGASGEAIQADLTTFAAQSHLPELVQRTAINSAIDAMAHKSGKISVYGLADGVTVTGSDGTKYNMGNDVDFIKLRTAGQAEITRTAFTGVRLYNAELLQKQTQVRADAASNIIDQLIKNPNAVIDEAPLRASYTAAGIGGKIKEIPALIEAGRHPPIDDVISATDAGRYSAQISDRSLQKTNSTYVTQDTLIKALADRQLNMNDYNKLQSRVAARDGRADRGGRTAADPQTVKDIFDRYQQQIRMSISPAALANTPKYFKGNIFDAQNSGVAQLSDAFFQYKEAHPEMDAQQLNKHLAEYTQILVDYYLEPSMTNAKEVNVTNTGKGAKAPPPMNNEDE
jgi:hypothetical protein